MIKIQNLKKIYNGNTVLDIDNLGVAKGELIGLVGNNGAGKTTLLRLILDLIQADDGFVESNGQKVNESETWKEYTGSYIDGRFLIDFLTPEEYFDFIADVYNIDDETLQERLAQFEGFMHDEIMGTKKYLRDFSQGNRQKIGIIGAMIINPKVLLLDEPFNYLDPSSQMTIAHMIQRICKEQGTTVIISSHNLNFVADISSRILLLEKGKLVKDLPNSDGAAIAELNEYFGIQADDGFVESNGQKVNESETWKEYTGSYIDGRFLIDFLTPEEYFDFIADVYNIDDKTLQERLAQFEGFMHDEIMGTKKYLRDFSQGNRQKIGIIGAMIINPKVLLLDEPFNYLDPSSQMTIAHMIQRICKEQGTTVIISSHNLNFIADISTRILLLEKGKLVKDLPNADGAAIAELNEYFGIQAE